MRKAIILALFSILAFAGLSVSAQESKAVFKGSASNSTGIKFSDWDLFLAPNKPLVVKQTINVRQAHTFNFKAKKGQKISVKVVSKEPSAAFVVYQNKTEGEQIGKSSEDDKSWLYEFKTGGDYKIVLSADAKSNYTLTVKLY